MLVPFWEKEGIHREARLSLVLDLLSWKRVSSTTAGAPSAFGLGAMGQERALCPWDRGPEGDCICLGQGLEGEEVRSLDG